MVLDRDELTLVVERLLAHAGRKVDRLHPLVDARLDDGSRINVAVAPAAIGGPLVTIRRFRSSRLTLEDFATPEQAVTLRTHLRDGSNILVSGATGAGKTSLVGALMAELQPDERVVLIEDTAELPGDRHSVVRLEAQPAAVAGTPPVTLRDLVRNALRMRPDRLVLGEVRGPEALDLLLALTTGHRGSLSTCHGNGPAEVLERLAVLAQLSGQADPSAIESMVGSGIDLVVHVERSGSHRFIDAMLGVTDDWRQPR